MSVTSVNYKDNSSLQYDMSKYQAAVKSEVSKDIYKAKQTMLDDYKHSGATAFEYNHLKQALDAPDKSAKNKSGYTHKETIENAQRKINQTLAFNTVGNTTLGTDALHNYNLKGLKEDGKSFYRNNIVELFKLAGGSVEDAAALNEALKRKDTAAYSMDDASTVLSAITKINTSNLI
jgi:hypothetical protein